MSPGHRNDGRAGGRRRPLIIGGIVAAVVLVGCGTAAGVHFATRSSAPPPPATISPQQAAELRLAKAEMKQVTRALHRVRVALPVSANAPAPAYSSSIFTRPLPSHQVFAYLPYWALGGEGSVNYADFTTIAYFSLGMHADGAVEKSGLGWDDMQSQSFSSFRSAAHAARVRVLLTVATVNAAVLDSLSTHPATAAARFLANVRPLLANYNFDGVNLDLEGTNGADRAGFARFVELVAAGVHAARHSYTVAIDVYPQSASDPNSFYDVKPIGRSVDQLFIMGYDMEDPTVPSANAPLTGLGLSDVDALQTYAAVVPRSKLILGTPWYGVDWTIVKHKHLPATFDAPITLVYSQIVAGGSKPLWDPSTDTVWFRYAYHGRAHEVWFDNGVSLALKSALAAQYSIAGVGVWALGMDSGNTDLLSALVGGAPVVKLPLAAH
jgi:hypothetical protein